jgi:hypothetical protein
LSPNDYESNSLDELKERARAAWQRFLADQLPAIEAAMTPALQAIARRGSDVASGI